MKKQVLTLTATILISYLSFSQTTFSRGIKLPNSIELSDFSNNFNGILVMRTTDGKMNNWINSDNFVLQGQVTTPTVAGLMKPDFYEENTFTPVISGGTYTFTVNNASFIRIGNRVTITLTITSINGTSTSGDFVISGFSHNIPSGAYYGTLGTFSGSNLTNIQELNPHVQSGTSGIVFSRQDNTPVISGVDFTSGAIRLTITYMTDVYTH